MNSKIIFKIFLVLVVIIVLGGARNSYAKEKKEIEIILYGDIKNDVIEYIKTNLRDIMGVSVSVGKPSIASFDAYDKERKQYKILTIFKEISENRKNTKKKVLAIMDEDIYIHELNFVFGEADVASGVAIISLTRLRQTYYGFPEDRKLFLLRCLKEAIHVVGHLYNLDHCPNPLCVMHFSNRLADTDKKDYELCDVCLEKYLQ